MHMCDIGTMKIDIEHIMDIARKTATKSTMKYKVSCVLVDRRGRVVATGYNHRCTNGRCMGNHSVHAEADALSKVKKIPDGSNLTAFIYRMNSKAIDPCSACEKLLKAYGIENVFCTHETHIKKIEYDI